MAEIKFANNAASVLNGALTDVATTINVVPGEGAKFPVLAAGDWCYATIEEASPAVPAFPLREIVKVTARTGDALTVTRGQDGTTARAWLSGDKIELRWTAATVADLRAETAALDALKVSKAGDTMTGNLNVPSLNGGPLAGFRNKVINGAFNVWQRGTGPFTTANKAADMWNISWDGTGGTQSINRLTMNAGEEIEGCMYRLNWNQSVVGTGRTWNSLEGLIEDVRTLNGKQVTVSFWAAADTNRTVGFFLRQVFGSGGSANVDSGNTTFNVTSTWQKFTHTFTVPSISAKTIGINSKVALIFLLPITTFSVSITAVQLEEGPVATPFEQRPIGVELGLCFRFFQKLTHQGAPIGAGHVSDATTAFAYVPTFGQMKSVPVMHVINGAALSIAVRSNGVGSAAPTPANVSFQTQSNEGAALFLRVDGLSGLTANHACSIYTGNILALNAEL